MGQSRRIDDDKIWRKRTPSFPCHESIVPRNAQKQRWWKNINTLLRWWVKRLTLFFAQLFLLISSVSTEQSQICVKNTKPCHVRTERPVLARQSDPLVCANKFVDENTYTFDRWSCARRRSSGKAITTKSCDQDLYWCRISDNGWRRTVLHDNGHWRILTNLQNQWLVVSTLCQEMKNHLTRKVGFEGTPKLGPYWKSQPATYKINLEWKLELNL